MDPSDFAQVAPTVYNLGIVGIMATIFIVVAKFLLAKFPVPGLTTLFAAV